MAQCEPAVAIRIATVAQGVGAMHVHPRVEGPAWKRPALLAALGSMALFVGLLVYLTDRDPVRAVLMPSLAMPWDRKLFGSIGQWLPSFIHPLAFSLFTTAVLKPATAARLGACVFWGAVNVAFELGQHTVFKPLWAGALHGGAGDWVISRSLLNYELRGTFDPDDICASVLGAPAAAILIQLANRIQETPRAQT